MTPPKFKVSKHVTLPLFRLDANVKYLRFETAMAVGKTVDDKKDPPTMANVFDMETGELGQIILGTVLVSNLDESYPDNKYVGKIFAISKTAPEGTRKYSLFHITEVEEDNGEEEAPKTVADKAIKPEAKKAA